MVDKANSEPNINTHKIPINSRRFNYVYSNQPSILRLGRNPQQINLFPVY